MVIAGLGCVKLGEWASSGARGPLAPRRQGCPVQESLQKTFCAVLLTALFLPI